MSTYRLIYFQSRGRAEIIRYVLAQAGVEYEDKRVTKEEWAELKPKTPYGTLPVLEVDGKFLSSTGPIVRYLAEKHGLAGSNDFENAEIAGIADAIGDLAMKMITFFFENDETRKAELQKEFAEKHLPNYMGIFEKKISENPNNFLYGSKITYADLSLYNITDFVVNFNAKALDSFPAVQKHRDTIGALPNIAKWRKDRPEETPRQ